MESLELQAPLWLVLGLLPLIVSRLPAWRIRRWAMWYPETPKLAHFQGIRAQQTATLERVFAWLFAFGISLYLAEPAIVEVRQVNLGSGRDIHVIVDTSTSMEKADITDLDGDKRRLDSVKRGLTHLATTRDGDRLGLVAFGESAFVMTDLTHNTDLWLHMLNELDTGFAGEGTHLGDAVGYAAALLVEQDADSRLLVVITDGNDTGSALPPREAARLAAALDIRLFVIAVGTGELGGRDPLDLTLLRSMAEQTDGGFYHVQSLDGFSAAWSELSLIEPLRARVEEKVEVTSLAWIPLLAVLLLTLIVGSLGLRSSLRSKVAL